MREIEQSDQLGVRKTDLILQDIETRQQEGLSKAGVTEQSDLTDIVRFSLAGEQYAIYASYISSIHDLVAQSLTIFPIPGMPNHILGVINLRGEIIPIVDLREFFSLPADLDLNSTQIINIKFEENQSSFSVGLLVDKVYGLAKKSKTEIQPSLSTIEHIKADYIEGEIYEESGSDGEPSIVIGIINLGNVLLSEMGDRLDEYDT